MPEVLETEFSSEASPYEAQLRTMAKEIGVPAEALSDRGIALTAEFLDEMHSRFGDPDSETYSPYHNDQHAVNIIRRSWQLWTILRAKLPERFDLWGFEAVMLAGAGHDLINDPEATQNAPGQNEHATAEYVQNRMIEVGYGQRRARRVFNIIKTTTVARNEKGAIIQSFIRQGSRDPAKLVVAQADMNGVVMEGIPRMVHDALDLYFETSGKPLHQALVDPVDGAVGFLLYQAIYLGDRLGELDGDLDYYFDEREKALVREAYREAFSGPSRDAVSAAKMLAEFPAITKSIVETSFSHARSASEQGLGQLAIAKKFMIEQLQRKRRY